MQMRPSTQEVRRRRNPSTQESVDAGKFLARISSGERRWKCRFVPCRRCPSLRRRQTLLTHRQPLRRPQTHRPRSPPSLSTTTTTTFASSSSVAAAAAAAAATAAESGGAGGRAADLRPAGNGTAGGGCGYYVSNGGGSGDSGGGGGGTDCADCHISSTTATATTAMGAFLGISDVEHLV